MITSCSIRRVGEFGRLKGKLTGSVTCANANIDTNSNPNTTGTKLLCPLGLPVSHYVSAVFVILRCGEP